MYRNNSTKFGALKKHAPKLLFIMRLTTVILIATMLQVSASSLAQKVTYVQKEVTLAQLFKVIKDQTGYNVVWYEGNLDAGKTINANFRNTPVEELMDQVLKYKPLSYAIEKQTIVIKEKTPSFLEKIVDRFTATTITGYVTDTLGNPLIGATVNLKGSKSGARTSEKGFFSIESEQETGILVIAYLGYKTQNIRFDKSNISLLKVVLKENESTLEEVSVVSTGYDKIPKERATGSFTQIDNSLLNRSVSTNILDRLNGVASGLIFTVPGQSVVNQGSIEIHGRSTLFAKAEPLVILDNFPYEGNLGNINPNDIESITVLKDAAAASAWGARSGNGVIVITTKKGSLNMAAKIGFNANINIGEKPDLYYSPQLTSSEFIDVQQFLYRQGAYTTAINDGYSILSPAVEIFNATKNGLSESDSLSRINTLKGYDVRDQLSKYFYRPSINQQYQANITGGSSTQKYFVSAGYDKNLASVVGNSYNRITLNASNTYYFFKNRLELFSNIIYTNSRTAAGQTKFLNYANPYDQVADASGNPLAVADVLRLSYAQSAGGGKLLNWLYKPLEEVNNGFNTTNTNLTDYRINISLSYNIFDGLKASALYNYEKGISDKNTLYEVESYYTRNMINKLTQINQTTGATIYPLPLGEIYYDQVSNIQSNNGRFQLNYNKVWSKHAFSGIAGTEVRQLRTDEIHNQFYGYNRETETNQNGAINYTINNPYFYNSSSEKVVPNTGKSGTLDRFVSYYFNGSYTYSDKYIFSLSARKDESNLFGVASNQKGVPLWSAGLAWLLNKESFYHINWLPQLKFRATFGYTGNVDNSLSAYLTSSTTSAQINQYNTLYAIIVNPPNPSLRWEKIRNINLGLDFSTKGNRINGSIDLWQKKGIDLIGNSPIAPQTGIVTYKGNSANTLTKGVDVELNSINLNGDLKWYTTLLYNYSNSKVTDYKVSNGTNYNVVSSNYNNPLAGYPYYAIFSFKYAGLNLTGDPQGYLNGVVSTDYSGISNSTNRSELVYNGSATPTSFGSLRNTFIYKKFDLSFNISYRLGYYFRRNSLQNTLLYNGSYQMADYGSRWQKPGDELITNVPAPIYPGNVQRDNIYTYSDALVEKADNIRLQDIRLGFTFPNKPYIPFRNLNLFTYINNVGILWRANKYQLDPDYPTGIPSVRTVAFGLKADL